MFATLSTRTLSQRDPVLCNGYLEVRKAGGAVCKKKKAAALECYFKEDGSRFLCAEEAEATSNRKCMQEEKSCKIMYFVRNNKVYSISQDLRQSVRWMFVAEAANGFGLSSFSDADFC
jgi:hypothetical protein